ncbi:MAG: TonB-dependent receptor [Lentisphaerae bacterium]|nr:TonB-dependent receptor [Lentisphaerota bacterium]
MKSSMPRHPTATALACVLLGCLPASAADTAAAVAPMPELRVTAARSEQGLSEVPLSVWVLTRDQIESRPHRSVGELLRDLPGVEMEAQSTPGMVRLHIRGESPSRVAILIDGQRLSEHKSMLGIPLLMSPADIERIEVIRGPGSVLYGSEAIGGVVNVITRRGGTAPVNVATEVSWDSVTDGWSSSGSLSGRWRHLEYNLAGIVTDHDDRETPAGMMAPSSWEARQGSAYAGWRSDRIRLGLRVERYTSELDSYPVIVPPLVDFRPDVPAWDRDKVALFLDVQDLAPALSNLHLDIYRQTTRKHFTQGLRAPMGPFGVQAVDLDIRNDLETWGATLQLDWTPHPDHVLITGAEIRLDALEDDETQWAPAFDPGPPPGLIRARRLTHDEATQEALALFARDEWRLAPDWTLDLGVRQTWVRSELDESNRAGVPRRDASDAQAVASLALVNRSFDNLALRTGVHQGYRFPSLQEIYTGTQHSQDQRPVLGNTALKPETSNGLEIGGRFDNRRLLLDLSVFYTASEDYITYQLQPGGAAYQFLNVDESTSYGLEALTRLTLPCGALSVEPYLQGTYLRRSYDDGQRRTWRTGYPRLSGRGGLRCSRDIGKHCRISADAYLRAAAGCDEESLIDGTLERFAGWTTANLETGLQWTHGQESRAVTWHLTVGMENLTDREYQHVGEVLTAPGRNLFVKAGCRF